MNPLDLIKTARDLIESTDGKPRQSNLHRATSTAYYALFHTLARSAANLLIGGPGSKRSAQAWQQVYRALEHGHAKTACMSGTISLSKDGQGLRQYVRHDAGEVAQG